MNINPRHYSWQLGWRAGLANDPVTDCLYDAFGDKGLHWLSGFLCGARERKTREFNRAIARLEGGSYVNE